MLSRLLSAWCGFWAGVLVCLGLFVALLSLGGCAAGRRVAEQAPPEQTAPDSLAGRVAAPVPVQLAGVPAYLVPPPAGSSPRQRRQWQRAQARNLERAGVLPVKVKNSSVATAPGAVAVNRPSAPVAMGAGAVATDARKQGQRHGAGAAGPGAKAEATDNSGGTPWWVFLLVGVLGAVGWEILSAKVAPLRALLRWRVAVG